MKRILAMIISAVMLSSACCAAAYAEDAGILTDNTVVIAETVSDNGFVHPGIGFTADSLNTMRDMVKQGVSPWADYFEGMRRTRYADLNGELKKQEQIVNNGGISSFADDAQRIWVQAMLYFVTGNEEYRRLPVEAIKFYGGRADFFPAWFSDSHIKLGKYVRTFCEAAELMRYTEPRDESLAVTDEMIQALDENCLKPISDKCLCTKTYFMNQHSYALQGYIAETVLAEDRARYEDAVEMTTVNSGNTLNKARNGAIANVIRIVTADEETGEPCEPHWQLAEMGRDQDHAKGNIDNFVLLARTADAQRTRVDPVSGAVTAAEDGVSVTAFRDDSIIRGAEIFFEYNMGYDVPWTTIYSENSRGEDSRKDKVALYRRAAAGYRGRLQSTGTMAMYYRYKGLGYDIENEYPMLCEAAMKVKETTRDFVYTGTYIDTIHNYDFDFWTDLAPASADSAPDPARARRILAKELEEYTAAPSNIIELEDRFIDLNVNGAYAQLDYPHNASDMPIEKMTDSDGTAYAHMPLSESDARTMVVYNADMPKNKIGLRVRTEGGVELKLYNKSDYGDGEMLSVTVPNTNREWRTVILDFSEGSVKESARGAIWYLTAQSYGGAAYIDFDKLNTSEEDIKPLEIPTVKTVDVIAARTGEKLEKAYTSDDETAVCRADALPEGAELDGTEGILSWTPAKSGDYALTITADNGTSVYAKEVIIKVRDTLEEQLAVITENYDAGAVYTAKTRAAFEAAKEKAAADGSAENLNALQTAVNGLEELNPALKYGGIDYSGLAVCSEGAAIENLVDNAPGSGITKGEPDMNITLDFGRGFKVRADSFEIQAPDGFPARCLESAVYGSDDGTEWIRLAENSAVISDKMQTLTVSAEQKDKAYRYLRIYMPNGTNKINENAYIMGVGEFRINGERLEADTPDYHKAYIEGYDDGSFLPDENMTRAEAAVLLSRTVSSYMDNGQCANGFADVAEDAWYTADLAYMAKRKFITADADKCFRPEDKITRGEFCDFVVRLKGLKGDAESGFNDTEGSGFEKQIALVSRQGWIEGYDDGSFRPGSYITRAEIAAIVCRMENRSDYGGGSVFNDVSETHWAYDVIAEAAKGHFE